MNEDRRYRRYKILFRCGLVLLVTGLIAAAGHGLAINGSLSVAVFGVLLALTVLTIGTLLGFIFGIPRSIPGADNKPGRSGYAVNTNLEQISDWLTKIIVGVGLVEFTSIVAHYGKLNGNLAVGLGGHPHSSAVAGVIVAFFGALGFLLGYVITRTLLANVFQDFDNQLDAGIVAGPLRQLRSTLASIHSGILARTRDLASASASADEITADQNREPIMPAMSLDVDRVDDLVDLSVHVERLLGELIYPISPRERTVEERIAILTRRGVLDQPAAAALRELMDAADQVAGGAELSPEDAAAVRNAGMVVLRQLSTLRSLAFAAFESHVLDELVRGVPLDLQFEVLTDVAVMESDTDMVRGRERRPAVTRVDAVVVFADRYRLLVEVRPRVRTGESRHFDALWRWISHLPEGSRALLVLPGERLHQREIESLRRVPNGVTVEFLLWDTEADELWQRIRDILLRG